VPACLEFRLQNLDRDAQQAALQLHKPAIDGDAAVHGRKRPNAPSRPMFAVSIAIPFSRTVNMRGLRHRGRGMIEDASRLGLPQLWCQGRCVARVPAAMLGESLICAPRRVAADRRTLKFLSP
jgi:hypothetical protein